MLLLTDDGEVKVSGSATATVDLLVNSPPAPFASWNQSTIKAGWTIGAGMQQAIDQNWSLMLEYLYVDLGSESAIGSFAPPVDPQLKVGYTWRFRENIARVGVNYHFN